MCSSPSPQVGWSGGPVHPRRALGALQLASPFSANSRFAPGPKQTGPERKFNLQVRPRPNFRFRSRSCRTQVNLRVWGQLGLYRNTLVTECGFGSQLPVGGGRGERRKTIQAGPVGSGTPSARRPAPARNRSLPWIRKRTLGPAQEGRPPGQELRGGAAAPPAAGGAGEHAPPLPGSGILPELLGFPAGRWCTAGTKRCPTCRGALTHADGQELPVVTRGMQAMHHFNEHEAYGEVWCHGRTEVGIRNGVTCREEKRCGCLRGLDTPAEALVKLRLCSGQEGHGSLNNGCYLLPSPLRWGPRQGGAHLLQVLHLAGAGGRHGAAGARRPRRGRRGHGGAEARGEAAGAVDVTQSCSTDKQVCTDTGEPRGGRFAPPPADFLTAPPLPGPPRAFWGLIPEKPKF